MTRNITSANVVSLRPLIISRKEADEHFLRCVLNNLDKDEFIRPLPGVNVIKSMLPPERLVCANDNNIQGFKKFLKRIAKLF